MKNRCLLVGCQPSREEVAPWPCHGSIEALALPIIGLVPQPFPPPKGGGPIVSTLPVRVVLLDSAALETLQ